MWTLDSGASCHYCQSLEGLTEVKEINESIKIENGNSMKETKIGNLKCELTQIDDKRFTVTSDDVNYLPNLGINLFGLNKALKKGFKVINDDVIVSLNYKHVKLTFDRVINAIDGCVTEILMKPLTTKNINGYAIVSISNERNYYIDSLYKLFGHCGQETLNNTIEMYGFKSSGNFESYEQELVRFKKCVK
jgi:hypothetical protein